MKILYVMTPAFDPNAGGVQKVTYNLGRYFYAHGHDMTYYSFSKDGHSDCQIGTLYQAPETGRNKNQVNQEHFLKVLQKVQPDVIINQMSYEKEIRAVIRRGRKNLHYLVIGCLHNSLFNFRNNIQDRMRQMLPKPAFLLLNNPLGRGLIQLRHWVKHRRDLKAIVDEHDFFVLLTPSNRKEMAYFVGEYKPEKVTSIPNSIPGVLDAIPSKERIILHVGRLNIPQKRSDLLLPFWEKLHEQLPDWRFVIVGDGEYADTLAKELEAKKLPRMFLKGFQQPDEYYRKAAIFMMPSAYEGFPNTIIEAQSYGCVPLAFNSYAALEWIVNDGSDALLCPPFDTSDMAAKVQSIATDTQRLHHMQTAALENVQRFTIERVGEQWLTFFEKNRKPV